MKQRKSTIGPENLLLTQPRKKVLSGNKLTCDGTELPWPSKFMEEGTVLRWGENVEAQMLVTQA